MKGRDMEKIQVAIIMGSDSDAPVMKATTKILSDLGLSFSINIASAHRSPEHVQACVKAAVARGVKVFIAAAGMSAALPGVVAAETILPVIGVPMEGKTAAGLDALLSIAQMPPGIPVATVAVGPAGATNAAILAAEMIAISDDVLRERLNCYRAKLAAAVVEKDAKLSSLGLEGFLKEMGK
ncbi:MAG: 5-(carboxyamino)imidazole ribonucleotide mutase [Endomicrobiales bacterium]|jgi:5-(carboxyamino)imidazole ribonucleotide mutase